MKSSTPNPHLTLQWVFRPADADEGPHWNLIIKTMMGTHRAVATVWENGTWHTWDQWGTGGENSSEGTVQRAKVEAAASAIEQGFC